MASPLLYSRPAISTPAIFATFPEVVAGCTLRQGTEPAYRDANMAFKPYQQLLPPTVYAQVEKEAVGRRLSLGSLTRQPSSVHFLHQTHSGRVVMAYDQDVWGQKEGDALVTHSPGKILCLSLADCAGVLLYEPTVKVVAAAHSGWRGTRANIVQHTIHQLADLGAHASRMYAYISPTACPAHYEVGEEFQEFFAPTFLSREHGHLGFDNTKAITAQLQEAGVPLSHIEVDTRCTVEDKAFHSYRRDGRLAGRFTAFIGLQP